MQEHSAFSHSDLLARVIVSPFYLIAPFEGLIVRNLNVSLVSILKERHDKKELSCSRIITRKSLSLKWDAVNGRPHSPCIPYMLLCFTEE
jgi:hypothetical protein